MEFEKVVESTKFLLKSIKRLSDHILEAESTSRRQLEQQAKQTEDLFLRLAVIETELRETQNLIQRIIDEGKTIDQNSTSGIATRMEPYAIGLAHETLLSTYDTAPSLLQPFARTCCVSKRSVVGTVSDTQIELDSEGVLWIFELIDGDWWIIPRPGSTARSSQQKNLQRIFEIHGNADGQDLLELIEAGKAMTVEYGRRWVLSKKGLLATHSDPLKQSLEKRIRNIESRLSKQEEKQDLG